MTRDPHPTGPQPLTWRKSSFSTAQGECVEVAPTSHQVLVRDSKHPDGAWLTVTAGEWAAFLAGARAGEFESTSRP